MAPCHSLAPPRLHKLLGPCALSIPPLQQPCLPKLCCSGSRVERSSLRHHSSIQHQGCQTHTVKTSHLNRHTRVVSAAASPAAAGTPSTASSAAPLHASDLVLELEGTSQKIHVFGVEHTHPQPHIGKLVGHVLLIVSLWQHGLVLCVVHRAAASDGLHCHLDQKWFDCALLAEQ
eukprot:1140568-Pelagomonas_calceolata.AAC.3